MIMAGDDFIQQAFVCLPKFAKVLKSYNYCPIWSVFKNP